MVAQTHRYPVTYTKKLPFKPTQTQWHKFTWGFPNTGPPTPISTGRLSRASPLTETHSSPHSQTYIQCQTTDSFFHLLGLGWGDNSLGAGLLETQIQETDAQLSHWGYADSKGDLSAFQMVNFGSLSVRWSLGNRHSPAQLSGALSRLQVLDVTGDSSRPGGGGSSQGKGCRAWAECPFEVHFRRKNTSNSVATLIQSQLPTPHSLSGWSQACLLSSLS